MPDARITIEGRIASDPRYSATQSGVQVGNLRILAGRYRRADDGTWETLSTTAYNVAFWREHHDLLASYAPAKGDSVVVTGTVTGVDSYDGPNGLSLSVNVTADGLRVYPKRDQQGGSQAPRQQSQPQQSYGTPQGDPWGEQGGYDQGVPF